MTPENPPAAKKGGSSVTGFDPEGLERAAKAARELDASRNAAQAIELIKTQEVTKQVRWSLIDFCCRYVAGVVYRGLGGSLFSLTMEDFII
jgi:hypothetical protein